MEQKDDNFRAAYHKIKKEYQKYRKLRVLCMRIYDVEYPEHLVKRIYEDVLPHLIAENYEAAFEAMSKIDKAKAEWIILRRR